MGRDRMRVLVCGIASIALIVAGALAMDWYRLAFEPVPGGAVRLALDLRNLHVCHLGQPCVLAPLTPLPGMFPTLAAVTLWSSLGVAAVVAFQAGFRVLTGSAYDSLTKLGYMVCLMALSIAVATAYMFGPEREGGLIGAAAQAGVLLQRTWGPVTLIAGLVAGFATLYMAVAPESSDLAAAYKPIGRVPGRATADTRTRTPSVRIPFPEHTGLFPMLDGAATGTAAGARPPERRAVGSTPIPLRPRPPSEPADDLERMRERPTTDMRARPTTDMRAPRTRTMAGIQPVRERTATGLQPIGARPTIPERTAVGSQPIGAFPDAEPAPSTPNAPSSPSATNASPSASPNATSASPNAPSTSPNATSASPNATSTSPNATSTSPNATSALPAAASRTRPATWPATDEPARAPTADPPPLRERAATGVYAIPAIALPGPGRARPATIEPSRAAAATTHPRRERSTTGPAAREITGSHSAGERTGSGPIREITGSHSAGERTGSGPIREITGSHAVRERTGSGPIAPVARPSSGQIAPVARPSSGQLAPVARPSSGQIAPVARPSSGQLAPVARPSSGQLAPVARPSSGQIAPVARPPTGPIAPTVSRSKTGPIIGAPPHLRQRLSYVAITAEITAGGIDARREDGLARLVLWRDVVGVVARRLPPVYDGLVFVDVVSSAGSTLRIVPWTRLAGEPITGDAIDRPRALIEHVSTKCPAARIDPATRHFLETGTAAQLPDLETLRAHDERLA